MQDRVRTASVVAVADLNDALGQACFLPAVSAASTNGIGWITLGRFEDECGCRRRMAGKQSTSGSLVPGS